MFVLLNVPIFLRLQSLFTRKIARTSASHKVVKSKMLDTLGNVVALLAMNIQTRFLDSNINGIRSIAMQRNWKHSRSGAAFSRFTAFDLFTCL